MTPFQLKITEIRKIYIEKYMEIHVFRMFNMQTEFFFERGNSKMIEQIFESINSKTFNYKEFLTLNSEINNQKKSYKTINLESAYKLYFQIFEEYLSEIIYACLFHFPKLMNTGTGETKNEIPFEKIFDEQSTIDDIKDFLITHRVKKIIQSNNITEILSKMETILSCKFKFNEKDLDFLFLTSLNRNILTHNNGIVNEVYLNLLSKRKIESALNKGDNIINLIETNILNDAKNQMKISEIIYDVIKKDSIRLEKHHEKL